MCFGVCFSSSQHSEDVCQQWLIIVIDYLQSVELKIAVQCVLVILIPFVEKGHWLKSVVGVCVVCVSGLKEI